MEQLWPHIVRWFPVGVSTQLRVLVAHGTVAQVPCVVFSQADTSCGAQLFEHFAEVAMLYEIELLGRGHHPGQPLKFVQARTRMTPSGPRQVLEEVLFRGVPRVPYAWRQLEEGAALSGSFPTRGWLESMSR